tara:strand:+ start:312 stop:974 length:663 start_codon:yes stop_codon:yes gene_type:complete
MAKKKRKAPEVKKFTPEWIVGIDNGTSGAMCVLKAGCAHTFKPNVQHFWRTTSKEVRNYQIEEKYTTRLDVPAMIESLMPFTRLESVVAVLERPLVNPSKHTATLCAVRCFEAQLVVLEHLGIPYRFIDSREWQGALLPRGVKGSANLKEAGRNWCREKYPHFAYEHDERKPMKYAPDDADAVLIAYYATTMLWGDPNEPIRANSNGAGWLIPRGGKAPK